MLALLVAAFSGGALEAHWKIPVAVRSWKTIDTVRFRIHYPAGYEEMALAAAVYAEQAAERCDRVLEHRLTKVVPIFIFASHQDFASANIFPGIIGEGTGGFTDFERERVVVPFSGDYFRLRHVLAHEIVHAYQFDMLRGESYGRYPLWLMEGMAEYLSIGFDASAESYVRDAVLYGRFPGLAQLQSGRVPGYAYYKAGQAFMLHMAEVYGEQSIGRLLRELRSFQRLDHAVRSTFRIRIEDFDIRMRQWVSARYARAMDLPRIDRRQRRVTFRYRDQIGFHLHPVLSPDGRSLAYLTVDRIFPAIVIRPAPGPDVHRKRVNEVRIVLRALRSSRYEEWHPLSTRISFTPDGKQIVISARDRGRQAIVWVDLETGSIARSLRLPFDAMHYPVLSPNGRRLAFVGIVRGRSDLYVYEIESAQLQRLTNDVAYESDPAFSRGGGYVYFTSDRHPSARAAAATATRDVYRVSLSSSGPPVRLTRVPGTCDRAQAALEGSLLVRCDLSGVANLYRLSAALRRRTPAGEADLEPVTGSATGIHSAALRVVSRGERKREWIALTEYEEGAYEVRVLPPLGDEARVSTVARANPLTQTFSPADYRSPLEDLATSVPFSPTFPGADYRPALALSGTPFVLIAAGQGASGRTAVSVFAFGQLADDTGDHRVRGFLNYQDTPVTVNADLQYAYLKSRTDYFVGAYSQSGTFPISNFLDFSFNNVLYNPNFRLLDQRSNGVYAGADHPLHRFAALTAVVEHGRDEKVFRQTQAEEREQEDIFLNYQQLSVAYRYDNAVYSIFGPLDGTSLIFSYSVPLRRGETFRELYSLSTQLRWYHLFSDWSTFAVRFFGGVVSGADADRYPYRIGGFYSLRGYRFLEFEGTHAFLLNLEYRFPFIPDLRLAFPFRTSIGMVRGVLFFDAGAAFDDPRQFQGFDRSAGVTRDLNLSFGAGLQWVNFLFPIIPGTIMKIEWATPYDTKRALPLSKWRGQFSLGFSFD